ncbi:MAG TPA: Gfo/Idh/MocA family oxidoreductase [Isosphaeraceae bacterium]|jgi:predicted dehydrogenase|nr:Gfo/Idh/MocA family oxidoreductase [Isosphaeraceae bacterium]
MIGIGICGIGFMGMIHYLAAQALRGGGVVAVCSREPKKLAGDWTSIRGNFGPRGEQMDLSGVHRHADFADLLADAEVDLVDLCVPNDEHATMAIRALEAGKHVLVEKPIALEVADADAMLDAAAANGRMLLVAQVLPFLPEFAFAREAVASGKYGRLRAAHFTRVISKPDWSSGIADADRSGGPAIDLHIHDTHFIGLLAGPPSAVHARGVVEGGAVVHLTTQYLYENSDLAISAVSGALSQAGRPFTHGYEIYLEHATLTFSFANLQGVAPAVTPVSVILPDGTVERPELGPGDPIAGFTRELEAAVGGVAAGNTPAELSGLLARQALATCKAEVEGVKSRQVVPIR